MPISAQNTSVQPFTNTPDLYVIITRKIEKTIVFLHDTSINFLFLYYIVFDYSPCSYTHFYTPKILNLEYRTLFLLFRKSSRGEQNQSPNIAKMF